MHEKVWAPYLERYAMQLPLVYPNDGNCHPRSRAYPGLRAWYAAMEGSVPSYMCRVRGDARHWRSSLERVLRDGRQTRPTPSTIGNDDEMGGDDNDDDDDDGVAVLPPASEAFGWWMEDCPRAEEIWSEYVRGGGGGDDDGGSCGVKKRPWLADTPGREMASYLMRHREDVLTSFMAISSVSDMTMDDADEALREVVRLLLDWRMNGGICPVRAGDGAAPCRDDLDDDDAIPVLSDDALRMSIFVCDELIEVPRDVGMIPALALGSLIKWALG